MRNKAQIGTLQTVIIALVVIGIVLGVGFLLLEEFKGTLDDEAATVTNERVVPTTAGVYVTKNISTANLYCYNAFAVTTVKNDSTAEVIAAGNYTINAETGLIRNLTSEYSYQPWNVTYTYKYGKDGCGGIESSVTAIQKVPAWLVIIVILLIVGILLAIVFNVLPSAGGGISFGRGSRGTVAEI